MVLNDPCTRYRDTTIDIGLLIFPELRSTMLAEGVDETVGVEHRQSFRGYLTMIPRFCAVPGVEGTTGSIPFVHGRLGWL